MNKKGFTLIEILMTIGIIALITAITIPGVLYVNKQIKKKNIAATEKLILNAAKLYGEDHKNQLFVFDEKISECQFITLDELMQKGYYEVKNVQKLENDLEEDIDEYKIILWLKSNTILAEKYDPNKSLPECKITELDVRYEVLVGSPDTWQKSSEIKLKITSNSEIKYWALVEKDVKPTKNDYMKITTPNKEITVSKTLKDSGEYIIWIKDMAYNVGKSKEALTIKNIE